MIGSIIRWILGLLGMGGAERAALNAATHAATAGGAPNPDQHRQNLGKHIKGLEHVQGIENIRIVAGDVVRAEQGASLIRDEDDGSLLWTNTWNKEIPAAAWQDEWGPVNKDMLDDFWHHKTEFDMLHSGDPEEAERKVQSFGYRDVGHLFQVEITFLKYNSSPDHGPTLDEYMWDQARISKAAMAGMHKMQAAKSEAAVAANPEMLAPVEGVDLETYAKLAANAASGKSGDEFNAMLAQHGLDGAKWQRVNAEWTDRMSKDTTFTITTAYSKAFQNVGAGQFGGAAQATAAVQGTTNAAGGAEPVPFEKMCEIQGAMSAWSKTGQDVNGMLQQSFGMTAVDWSSLSSWWMTKMTNEMSYFDRYNTLVEQYEKH